MIVIGLAVASAGSVDYRVNTPPTILRKEWVAGDIEYERGPQKVTPSKFP